MPNASRCYAVNITAVSVSSIKTLIQILAGATTALEILRASGGQTSSTTSTQLRVQLNRKSAAATVSSFTPLKLVPSDPSAAAVGGASATGTDASGEGTDTDIVWQSVFNFVGEGWLYLPTKDERIHVPPTGLLGLKFPVAPSAITVTAQVIFRELN